MEFRRARIAFYWRAQRGRAGESPDKSGIKIDTANHGRGSEEMLQSRSPSNR